MRKLQLLGQIYKAFKDVALEEGVGLWEDLVLDDRLEITNEH
ncbi:hypothetical protein [Oceanihabitans sp. IOP_32]|nr:hypothetical protein [Oceanihabitans sp. IOP_32]